VNGPSPRVAGLILAAGESRRMGSPKPLLTYRGEFFLDRLTGLFAEVCDPVIVVLGSRAGEIRAQVRRPAAFVENPDFLNGQTSSMQCGLSAVPSSAAGVLFTLVDHPVVERATLDALLAPPLPLLRVPRYGPKRGHPVWFSRELIPEFLALHAGGAARDVVHRHVAETEYLDVDDPGILADIDDPEAYRALEEAAR
jgi:molybdenum cofactor cytidylyltransferase